MDKAVKLASTNQPPCTLSSTLLCMTTIRLGAVYKASTHQATYSMCPHIPSDKQYKFQHAETSYTISALSTKTIMFHTLLTLLTLLTLTHPSLARPSITLHKIQAAPKGGHAILTQFDLDTRSASPAINLKLTKGHASQLDGE